PNRAQIAKRTVGHEGVEQSGRLEEVDEERQLPKRRHRRLLVPLDPDRPEKTVQVDPFQPLRHNHRLLTRPVSPRRRRVALHALENARFSPSRQNQTAVSRFNIHGRGFLVFLSAMTALPPLAIDMALPSLALVQADLGATQTQAAATIAIFLAGFSTAPLIVGPLADRFGRKPVLVVGLLLFALCGLGAAFAPSIGLLLGLRLVQGAGAGAVGVLPRAIVRDLFDVRESRLFLTAIAQVNGVAPVIAPSIGALILYVAPWRTIYLALAAIGAFMLVLGLSRFRESQPVGVRQSLEPVAVAANYGLALTNRFCLGFSLVLGLTFGGMFSYINT